MLDRVHSRSRRANRLTHINDFGLILIAIGTGIILLLIGQPNRYDYLSAGALLLIVVYITIGRIRRKKQEAQFDRSVLGDLDQAIHSIRYETRRAQTFFWWFLLQLAIPTFLNMFQSGAPDWKWLIVLFAFVCSYLLVRWELQRKQLPRQRSLEELRELLTSEE